MGFEGWVLYIFIQVVGVDFELKTRRPLSLTLLKLYPFCHFFFLLFCLRMSPPFCLGELEYKRRRR